MSNKANFPDALAFLFEPKRYKIAYGGRGASKSWGFARALLILGTKQKLRILCARETMKSIRDSVHQLLEEQIAAMSLEPFYRIEKSVIYGNNGTEFLFAGLAHNIDAIKSMEGVSICWVEEAQVVTKSSWDKLIPTLFRVPDCELWVSFNPDLETDNTYQRFVVDPPEDAIVVKLTYRDNPWFPAGLQREMEETRKRNLDEFNHIWEGCCINTLVGSIFAAELRQMDTEGRVRQVPYDRSRPVDTFWDLGYGDMTAIWFAQAFPLEFRLIDYLEDAGKPIHWYLAEMGARGYVYGNDYLPWDIGMHAGHMGGGRSIEELMRQAGRHVRLVPKISVADGINMARTIFPMCWFDRERTADGLQALRHYRYGANKNTEHVTREPLHTWASHAADAFRYLAVSIRQPQRERQQETQRQRQYLSPWA